MSNDITNRIKALSPEKRKLFERLAQEEGVQLPISPIIPRRTGSDYAPLSFGQERLWFLHQLDPESTSYNESGGFRLYGPLDAKVFEDALNEIIRRHEILRTTYVTIEGKPAQFISPSLTLSLPIKDLSSMSEKDRYPEALRIFEEETKRPFDLSKGPMIRYKLLRLNDKEHWFIISFHHIACDGWSTGLFLREFILIYQAFSNNQPCPLSELPAQYADYALWQRERMQGETEESLLSYWKRKLAKPLPPLDLPTDLPRPAVYAFKRANYGFTVPQSLYVALKDLKQREEVTLFMTLLAAFKVLLYRYTGQEDIIVESPIADRKNSKSRRLIGFFINTLVLRTELSGNPTFKELLNRVSLVCREAYDHYELPFDKLVLGLELERNPSRPPLGQVVFMLHKELIGTTNITDSTVLNTIKIDNGADEIDLTLFMWEGESGLTGNLIYNANLFLESSIARITEQFKTLLESIVSDPDQRISDLPALTEIERHQLLVEWNDTERKYPKDQCIHELFEAQVERTPEAITVVCEGEQITYRELNKRANQLAHYLISLGVGPETLVGVCLDRSIEMIVGLLGILKAGGAYLPLEPTFPKERLALMLEDSEVGVLLTQEKLLEILPRRGVHIVCVDSQRVEIAKKNNKEPLVRISPDSLAYVIYTSGSTGKPKGVQVLHRSVVNFLSSMSRQPGISSKDKILALTTLSFDIAVLEIFLPIIKGARVELVSREVAADGTQLLKKITDSGATVIQATPATWRMLLATGWQNSNNLKILCGGEALTTDLANQLLERSGSLWNVYGPTETTIWSTLYEVKELSGSVPIGLPIANTEIYILDKTNNPVPIGVPGELYIGGIGLARGYLNRPDLTAEKFTPNPFSDKPGGRLYRTGDLARYLPDRNIEFLGRIDNQVKIRGFRVETGEIESILREHPYVNEAVVVAREDATGEKQLIAYLVTHGEEESIVSELREFLKQKLPQYMVPSYFVTLDELPLTPSGKVDGKALPEPDRTRPGFGSEFVAPRNATEEILADIWSQVLGIERVGVYDNFFELGGHSLLATQVVSHARDTFKVELPLRSLIEEPTVARLGEIIDEETKKCQGLKVPQIEPVARDGELPLSFAQERLWFLDQLDPGNPAYNIAGTVRVKGRLKSEVLKQCINEIIRRHESLRTTFYALDGKPYQAISPEMNFSVPVVNLSRLSESERESEARRLAIEYAQQPFDLSKGPLVRAKLLELAKEEFVIILSMHHIISDGWSMGVLIGEFAKLYEAFSNGKPSHLPTLTIQYPDFAHWQRRYIHGEALDESLSYWKNLLGGESPILKLPTDRPRPAVKSYRGSFKPFVLSPRLSEALKKLSAREEATLFMTLLAAFAILLYRYTGQEDIPVGTPIANRNRSEIEGLIGFFVNTLVLRTDLSGSPTFRELLGRVKETALDAYAHQDVPFEKLVAELNPDRDMNQSPLFQVMFVQQNIMMNELKFDDLILTPMMIDIGTTMFDLTLSMTETDRGLTGNFVYSTDLFDDETIIRMIAHFQNLLEYIATKPDCRISEIPIVAEKERHQLLVKWNNTKRLYRHDKCVHKLFEEQVEKTPEATAVVFEEKKLTYKELNEKANQLAHYLNSLGVGPGEIVALGVERSIEMVLGVLGILKAGGAYLPLDPLFPSERMAFMLEETHATVTLTKDELANMFRAHNTKLVCLDEDGAAIARNNRCNPVSGVTPEHLVYVIYTSGSTGRPKGVGIEHRQLLNYVYGIQERLNLAENTSFATVSTIAADLGNTVVFPSLLSGGCLHVISQERAYDSKGMSDYFERNSIDCLKIVPSHLSALRSSRSSNWMPRKCLILGGEASSPDIVKSMQELDPDCAIYNHYGPTEATIGALTYRVMKNARIPNESSTVPLGSPLPNTYIYILDNDFQPVPIGHQGEIYIGGSGVARGYINQPAQTAERFLPDPFSKSQGGRLYKTGDLGRYLPDGTIDFLGRTDNQVKIRGIRIELGEIEAALKQDPLVKDVVVLAREDAPGNKRLVAYVVPKTRAPHAIDGRKLYKLPNNLAVAQLNSNETHYMYKEIFESQAYLRHGVAINDGACIFDVGANIGLFMVFVNLICKNPKVYSFEPNPHVFDILGSNASLYGTNAKLFNFGLADKEKASIFTHYDGFSILSGFYADPEGEKEVVKTYMNNQYRTGMTDMSELLYKSDEILKDRFASKRFTARLKTLSTVIEDENIKSIDLLKINVEKSELDVLNGIKEVDWEKIRQIVMEVDSKQNLDSIRSLLKRRGYELAVDQDPLLTNTQLSYVYAIRPSKEGRLVLDQENGSHIRPLPHLEISKQISITELRSFMRHRLPEFMIPTAFAMMNKLPLTTNGKIDYKALPVPGTERPDIDEAFVAPSTYTEEVLERIFADTLGIDQVGIHDSFFDIGGDSLLATRAISKIQDAFRVELTHGTLFQSSTIAELAKIIDGILKDLEDVQAPPILPVARDKAILDNTSKLLTNLDDLSDEEVNILLKNMLPEGDES